jgi:hypothetical protein
MAQQARAAPGWGRGRPVRLQAASPSRTLVRHARNKGIFISGTSGAVSATCAWLPGAGAPEPAGGAR